MFRTYSNPADSGGKYSGTPLGAANGVAVGTGPPSASGARCRARLPVTAPASGAGGVEALRYGFDARSRPIVVAGPCPGST